MVQLDLPIQAELIDWMENQPVFPKFYWQSRDGQEEVVALGQVKTFTDPLAAEKVIHDDQRVWAVALLMVVLIVIDAVYRLFSFCPNLRLCATAKHGQLRLI